ncbi:carbamoyltransferase C-terminal domain-containing protein [Methylobacter sp.]|uniref:carbamoyltransferase C-terminal domain-containing protein n=1 Tax=Methylobacter sp. TaxID=2051955 RepID=UPI00120DB011|nr:carbamoyltransferase C-terminal domain-containing protein [Methylobacter sp.]TAK61770.1 MAG: carbamoyl transferase [Methylobacter sp.]
MNILGITSGSESGACLFQNGQIRLAVSEERLSRKKFDDAFPERAIAWILRESRLAADDIDLICYGFSLDLNDADEQALIDRMLATEPSLNQTAMVIIRQRITNENNIDKDNRRAFFEAIREQFPDTAIYNCSHHESHQAAAFAPSPFQEALIVTADGRGDFKSLTISRAGKTTGIEELYTSPSWRSLGYFYGRMTHLCGFTANRHEGKITGLAACGKPEAAQTLVESIIRLDNDLICPTFGELYTPFFTNYSDNLIEQAAAYSRDDLAAAAQQHLEKIVCSLIEKYAVKTGLRNICLAGGVFSNVKLNQKIRQLDCVDEVFVYPAMSDGGICAGSVYHYLLSERESIAAIDHVYLGPTCELPGANTDLQQHHIRVVAEPRPVDKLVALLEQQAIVGLVSGRSEFGPRALGNRSIIASAFDKNITAKINRMLQRDDFMPFAPSIAEDFAGRCLKSYSPSCLSANFMTLSFPVTEEFALNSPAAVHIDRTARPQIVTRHSHPFFYDLLIAWHQKTGGLCLLNTSFNIHEEPIVNSAGDVIRALEQHAVDIVFNPPNLFLSKS